MGDINLILGAEVKESALALSCHQSDGKEVFQTILPLDGDDREEEISQKVTACLESHLPSENVDYFIYTCEDQLLSKCKKMERRWREKGLGQKGIRRISRENAFVHYVMEQDEAFYRHTVLLFDFDGKELIRYRLFRAKKKVPREIKTEKKQLGSFVWSGEEALRGEWLDGRFAEIARQCLMQEVVSTVFLTGQGFEGGWLNRSLKVICDGKRAFVGQTLFSSGCSCYGMRLCQTGKSDYLIQAPETVAYESGVLDSAAGDSFVRITEAGAPWYETKGSLELILERGNKVDVLFVHTQTGEKQVESVELTGLPPRPRKTGRLRVTVEFIDSKSGVIFVWDKGFGQFVPTTNQVFMKEFTLV